MLLEIIYENMNIPEDQLESTKRMLRYIVDERTSAPWASYSEDELGMDEQDYEDIEKIQTVQDLADILLDQLSRDCLFEYSSSLDVLGKFKERYGDERDEAEFRQYLVNTYKIDVPL